MFDVLLFFGFATLIVKFGRILDKVEDNVDHTAVYTEQAQKKLIELQLK